MRRPSPLGLLFWCHKHLAGLWCAAILAAAVPFSAGAAPKGLENFWHMAGAAGISTPEEVNNAADHGLHLMLKNDIPIEGGMRDAISRNNTKYIDNVLWKELFKSGICAYDSRKGRVDCPDIDNDLKRTILFDNVRKDVDARLGDRDLAGFWILDDYPNAQIVDLLEQIHAIVQKESDGRLPTICSFEGHLQEMSELPARPDRFPSVVNFSPSACDLVAIYAYGRGQDPAAIDWSMSSLLPAMYSELQRRGWDPAREPVIGIPQTFSNRPFGAWVLPRSQDVELQTASFCKAGAIAILGFTWQSTSLLGQKQAMQQMFNTPSLREGFFKGVADCARYWNAS